MVTLAVLMCNASRTCLDGRSDRYGAQAGIEPAMTAEATMPSPDSVLGRGPGNWSEAVLGPGRRVPPTTGAYPDALRSTADSTTLLRSRRERPRGRSLARRRLPRQEQSGDGVAGSPGAFVCGKVLLEIVFKVIRRCDKELGREIVKVARKMPGAGQGTSQKGCTGGAVARAPLHQLSDQRDDQGTGNDGDLCDPHANDPSSVGAGVVHPLHCSR